jgi:hypothetical protein
VKELCFLGLSHFQKNNNMHFVLLPSLHLSLLLEFAGQGTVPCTGYAPVAIVNLVNLENLVNLVNLVNFVNFVNLVKIFVDRADWSFGFVDKNDDW